MAITPEVLARLAQSEELRIEALSVPTVPGEPGVFQIRPLAFVRDLNRIDMISGTLNNLEAEDEISSIVVLGPPGRRVAVFQHPDFSGRGANLTCSERCLTIVSRLNTIPPTTDPIDHANQAGGPSLDNRISSYVFR